MVSLNDVVSNRIHTFFSIAAGGLVTKAFESRATYELFHSILTADEGINEEGLIEGHAEWHQAQRAIANLYDEMMTMFAETTSEGRSPTRQDLLLVAKKLWCVDPGLEDQSMLHTAYLGRTILDSVETYALAHRDRTLLQQSNGVANHFYGSN